MAEFARSGVCGRRPKVKGFRALAGATRFCAYPRAFLVVFWNLERR